MQETQTPLVVKHVTEAELRRLDRTLQRVTCGCVVVMGVGAVGLFLPWGDAMQRVSQFVALLFLTCAMGGFGSLNVTSYLLRPPKARREKGGA